MTAPRAELLAIGDELTHGSAIDTNSAWLARQIEALGLVVTRVTVTSDAPEPLTCAIRDACARADVLVATGGLGPTEDDRTRHAAAAVAGVALEFDAASWDWISAWIRARGRTPRDDNRRQALVPAGAVALQNHEGTAPGLAMRIGSCRMFALPGVPSEMRAMFPRHVVRALRAEFGPRLRPLVHRTLNVLGPTEAALGERIAAEMALLGGDVTVGVTAHFGLLRVRIAASGASVADADRAADAMAARLKPRLGDELLFEGDTSLVEQVVGALRARDRTIATAESCTGGLLAKLLTDPAGASAAFTGGVVCYGNASKVRDLGVPAAAIEQHGAVSEPVVRAMAEGVAARFGADIGVGITGIAGPGGGSDGKPVGTVWFALCADGATTSWVRRIPPVTREFVRERAAFEALGAVLCGLRR